MPFPKGVMEKPNWLSLQMLGLRLKHYVVNCEIHPEENTLEYYDGDNAMITDFVIEEPQKIYESLSNSLFMRYSSLVILINCDCSCRNKILKKILKAMQCNKYLRHKLKLIYTSYHLQQKCQDPINIWQDYFQHHVNRLKKMCKIENWDAEESLHLVDVLDKYEIGREHMTSDDKEPLRDYFNFKTYDLENILLFQLFLQKEGDWLRRANELDQIFFIVDCLPLISTKELLTFFNTNEYRLAVHLKENVELYFYSINPALAVINNNYIFRSTRPGCGIREGSEKDVLKLIREFKIARIPYILTEDFSRAQLLDFVKYLSRKNLNALKSLIFIIMTHATSNNTIYTHDGELNFIEDILRPLQSNITLKETNISHVNVHCRGGLYVPDLDPDELNKIPYTKIDQLPANTSVFYSVPESILSPRRPKFGTQYIDSFCKSFRDLDPQSDVKILQQNTWNDLKNDSYYECLDCFDKSSELVVGNAAKPPCIKPMPTGASEFIPLVESIQEEFHDLNKMKQRDRRNLRLYLELYLESLEKNEKHDFPKSESATTTFCICANANEENFTKNLDQLKYFAPELDEDNFSVKESQ